MSIFKSILAFSQDYRVSQVGPLIFYRHEWAISRRHHHYVMCLKISQINIYLHIQRTSRFKKGASLIYFLALPYLQRTFVARNWNEIRNTLNNVRDQDLLLHVEKPVRESDTRFVPPWQAVFVFSWIYSAVYRAVARTRVLSLSPCLRSRRVDFVGKQNVDKTT